MRNVVITFLGLSEYGLQCTVTHPASAATFLATLPLLQATTPSILSLAGSQAERCVRISKLLVLPIRYDSIQRYLGIQRTCQAQMDTSGSKSRLGQTEGPFANVQQLESWLVDPSAMASLRESISCA